MVFSIDRSELEHKLEEKIVFQILNDMHRVAQMWNKGGALIHRVRAMGYLAETGARSIFTGKTAINDKSTFREMKIVDLKMYNETITFLYPLVESGIYMP